MMIPLVFDNDKVIINGQSFDWPSGKYCDVYVFIFRYFSKHPYSGTVQMPCNESNFVEFARRDVGKRDFYYRSLPRVSEGEVHIYYSSDISTPKKLRCSFSDLPGEVTLPQFNVTFKSFWGAYHALFVETATDVGRFVNAITYEECQRILSTVDRIHPADRREAYMLKVIQAYAYQHRDVLCKLPKDFDDLVYLPENRDMYWGMFNGQGKNILGKTLKLVIGKRRS